MPAITLINSAIYYFYHHTETSNYPPLLLIHSAGGSSLDWSPALRRWPNMYVVPQWLAEQEWN